MFDRIRAAYLQSVRRSAYREAMREAALIAEERADVAAELAPRGRLGLGLQRASVAHDIAIELRARAEVVR
jgi:hypothetical protein